MQTPGNATKGAVGSPIGSQRHPGIATKGAIGSPIGSPMGSQTDPRYCHKGSHVAFHRDPERFRYCHKESHGEPHREPDRPQKLPQKEPLEAP